MIENEDENANKVQEVIRELFKGIRNSFKYIEGKPERKQRKALLDLFYLIINGIKHDEIYRTTMAEYGGLYCVTQYMLKHQSYDVRILACQTFSFTLDNAPTELSVVSKALIESNPEIVEILVLNFMIKFGEEEDNRNK